MSVGPVTHTGRVAIIGVGILGASVGWNLKRRGAEVIFIDIGQPGEGVTNWSFSWVNASNKTMRRSYFDLNVTGMAAYRELADSLGPGSWWHPHGHLRWADEPAAEAKLLKTAELLTRWDYQVELCTGAEVRRRLEPALKIPGTTPVLFYPDEAWVHGRELVGRLVGRAIDSGAEHRFGTEVCEIGMGTDGCVCTVTLSDGSCLEVDAVVNAARGRTLPESPNSSAGSYRCAVNLASSPGSAVLGFRSAGPCTRPTSRFVLTEVDLWSSTVATWTQTSKTVADPVELARRLHEAARHVVPELGSSQITQTTVAERPIPVDGFPSVGPVSTVPGYYEAVTDRIRPLGPVIGRLLADEILDGKRDELLSDFHPERFLG